MSPSQNPVRRADLYAWAVAAAGFVFILKFHLLPALLAGLVVYSLIHLLTPRLHVTTLTGESRRWLALVLVAGAVVAAITLAGIGIASFFRGSSESVPALFQRMAEIIEQSRSRFPDWVLSNLPDNAEDLRRSMVEWLRQNARGVQTASTDLLRGTAHAIIGMVIGAMLALRSGIDPPIKPLTLLIYAQATRMADVFRRVVFAQVWISTINTILTWLYLGVLLPQFDVHLPFVKTLVAITFVAGLMPILGNLISNTAIFIVSARGDLADLSFRDPQARVFLEREDHRQPHPRESLGAAAGDAGDGSFARHRRTHHRAHGLCLLQGRIPGKGAHLTIPDVNNRSSDFFESGHTTYCVKSATEPRSVVVGSGSAWGGVVHLFLTLT